VIVTWQGELRAPKDRNELRTLEIQQASPLGHCPSF
jgi:hypothetical protein